MRRASTSTSSQVSGINLLSAKACVGQFIEKLCRSRLRWRVNSFHTVPIGIERQSTARRTESPALSPEKVNGAKWASTAAASATVISATLPSIRLLEAPRRLVDRTGESERREQPIPRRLISFWLNAAGNRQGTRCDQGGQMTDVAHIQDVGGNQSHRHARPGFGSPSHEAYQAVRGRRHPRPARREPPPGSPAGSWHRARPGRTGDSAAQVLDSPLPCFSSSSRSSHRMMSQTH